MPEQVPSEERNEKSIVSDVLTRDERVWVTAWCAVATDSRVTSQRVATEWADGCLARFRERFK
jgi:hypothetical protein